MYQVEIIDDKTRNSLQSRVNSFLKRKKDLITVVEIKFHSAPINEAENLFATIVYKVN